MVQRRNENPSECDEVKKLRCQRQSLGASGGYLPGKWHPSRIAAVVPAPRHFHV